MAPTFSRDHDLDKFKSTLPENASSRGFIFLSLFFFLVFGEEYFKDYSLFILVKIQSQIWLHSTNGKDNLNNFASTLPEFVFSQVLFLLATRIEKKILKVFFSLLIPK